MSLLEQESFIRGIPPFDKLKGTNLQRICEQLDVVYFKEGEMLLEKGTAPKNLYFIIKGIVQERDENEVISVYDHHEYFDPISLIENYAKHSFVTAEETICYTLERQTFIEVLHEEEQFERYFFQSISQKLDSNQANEKNKELANFMVARVRDAYIQTPVIVDASMSIYDAVLKLKEEKSNSLLVRRGDELGIVTETHYRNKFILNRLSSDEPIEKLAKFGLVSVEEDEFLFNAQLEMTKYGIKRLVVTDSAKNVVGVLDQISLASFFASHTYAISNELERAESVEDLRVTSENLIRVIKSLYAKGVKVRYISKLISQLNEKVFQKLYELIAPKVLLEEAALVVMGSEGRREQILKTDQDNALILSDACQIDDETLHKFTTEFTQTLISFGYPECPGKIMISNPEWVHKERDFKQLISKWIDQKQGMDFMNIAIFYDALCVAGDKKLLENCKQHLFLRLDDAKAFYAHFAKSVLSFETPLSMFANFVVGKNEHKDELDIKKGGIFPIVQGVRSLSLENKLEETNTVERLKKLNDLSILDREFTGDLIEAFTFMMTLRLRLNLTKLDKNLPIDNYINPNELSKLEKDLLKDSFKLVDQFKKLLTFHYKLNMLG